MGQQPEEIWGVAVMAPKQKNAADKHCFGDCGKISMGGVIADDMTGGLFVCCERVCPYEVETIQNYGSTMSFDRPHTVHLRLLREEPNTEVQRPSEAKVALERPVGRDRG
ncbi:hypothetical protein E4T66_18670 [Sinimarinibacterium sp. CAU 1509]|uniref:hypothetical protein n=1 Tax=Sinimarinibacterium sp. CAU 1509 TaxID=2562283 RepID=UPI0010AD9C63|nr:hypothetical protein [Sinimarinibacterium sp. CAU 1509]TJY57432.1 hypothetical protein E4T66_18670 [Sinimarinibacterium sp. CAU 1509]